ncbi:Pycsar system effector family protein [Domibacillus mangrovi]|uniref:Pycsar effector protein domain-containing protein n=1 Tax=Domibacillus mangrovi TaxID=1714354 RepID=A0A1Q5P7I6_9BACI|nr:Pycsar system effector family protein [Domibacillus mangrovi]OKL38235.1 hypothetical protein BLL40_02095 [Domibacillus mangrovi]
MFSEKVDFIKHHHNYLIDQIKFADVKAAGLITVNGLIINLLFKKISSDIYETIHFFSLFGCLMLLLAIVFSLLVVFPRTNAKAPKGLIFWDNITAMSKDAYIKEMKEISLDDLAEKMTEQNYFLANTAKRKFSVLKRAFYVSFLGYLLLMVAAIFWFVQSS